MKSIIIILALSGFLFNDSYSQNYWQKIFDQDLINIETSPSNNLFVGTRWNEFYKSTNFGNSWEKINEIALYNSDEILAITDSIIIVRAFNLFISKNGGETWSQLTDFVVSSIFYEKQDERLYIGTHCLSPNGKSEIYYTEDFGQSWTLFYRFPQVDLCQWVQNIFSVGNSIILADIVYSSPHGQSTKLFRSSDNGISWELKKQNVFARNIEQSKNGVLFLSGSRSGLLVSFDAGENWISRNINIDYKLDLDTNGFVFIPSYSGAKFSTDDGETWKDINAAGLNGASTKHLKINDANQIFLATDSGLFVGLVDSILTNIDNHFEIVFKNFQLHQNYPNPFNPATKISWQSPVSGHQSLKIYDVLGNEIATLVDEYKPAGGYEITWYAEGLPSGVYFYRFQAGAFIETKKMILLR